MSQPTEPKRLRDIVNEEDPNEQLDDEFKKLLLDIAGKLIKEVAS